MKIMMKRIFTVLSLATFVFVLSGCQTNPELDQLQYQLTESLEAIELFDNPGEAELADSNVDDLMIEINQNEIQTLAWEVLDESLTTQEKIAAIRAKFLHMKETHLAIQTNRTELGIAFQTLKSDFKLFRESELTLTEDEIILITAYIDELKLIREDLKATIGLVYPKLRTLRGLYNLANVDLILSTYTEVSEVLDLRLAKIMRLQEIVLAVDQIILDRME